MYKLGRNYLLKIKEEEGDDWIVIQPPFTIEFDVAKNNSIQLNQGSVRIYNLQQSVRNKLRKDPNTFYNHREFILYAGYGNITPAIMNGNVNVAWSAREVENMITEITCMEGMYDSVNSSMDLPVRAGASRDEIIATMIQMLPTVEMGAIGSFPSNQLRGTTYSGNTFDLLDELTDGAFYVDGNKAYALNDYEYIDGDLTVINSSSGLIGTPMRNLYQVIVEMVFEPRYKIGQLVTIDSSTGPNFNPGQYKVVGIKHRGMISPSVSGDCVTTLILSSTNKSSKLVENGK